MLRDLRQLADDAHKFQGYLCTCYDVIDNRNAAEADFQIPASSTSQRKLQALS
jgi:hypothetical protein